MWLRKPPVPQVLQDHLAASEKPVEIAETAAGEALAASPTHLTLAGKDGLVLREAWCVFSRLTWDESDSSLTLGFTDPGIAPLTLTLARTPGLAFLTQAREGIDTSHVFHAGRSLSNGTRVSAWILRDSRGELFSLTTATGAIPPGDIGDVERLEHDARQAVGLDG